MTGIFPNPATEVQDQAAREANEQMKQSFLTVEQAQAIINAFGPCTGMYECTSPVELVQAFNEAKNRDSEETVNDYLKVCLAVEGIQAERMDEDGACYREWKAAKPAVIAGLEALGYMVK